MGVVVKVEEWKKEGKDESIDSQMPKASKSPVDDDAGCVEKPVEAPLPRSSAFDGDRGRVYRACCRDVGVELTGVRNASPENDLLRGE